MNIPPFHASCPVFLCLLICLHLFLCRFAPISADWLQAQRPNKDALLLHDSLSHYYDEQLSLCNMLLSPAALEIETERVKQLEKGIDQQALELAEHGEETGAEGEVGLVLPTDLTEPNNERSLLYANNSATPKAVANVSAGTPAVGVTTQLSHSQDSSPEVLVQNSVESRYVLLLACFFDLPCTRHIYDNNITYTR